MKYDGATTKVCIALFWLIMVLKIPNIKLKKHKLIFVCLSLLFLSAGFFYFTKIKTVEAGWWHDDWNYRRAITINSAQISADLVNFPMLVSFTDSSLINKTQSNGNDIVFIEPNGNQLNHEIEKYDSTTGELVAWVNIPALDGDNDSTIYMYYGNQTIENQQRVEDVWDDNFKTVQHLEEGGTGTRYDSTKNNIDGTPVSYEGTEVTNGKIGVADDFDGTDNISLGMDIFSSADLIIGSISAWVKADTLDSQERTAFTIENDLSLYWDNYMSNPNYNFRSYINTGSQQVISTTSLSTGEFAYFTMAWDGANMRLYKNGNIVDTDAVTSPFAVDDHNRAIRIGSGFAGFTTWDGIIDEVRISNSVRSADWITTEYNNQNSPATFISLGPEEQSSSPALYLPFDEGFGTTAHDESSNHNDGTIVGATWKDESMCKSGKCLEFDGTGDYVEVADNHSLDLSNEFTLEAWVKPQSTNLANQTIISKEETPSDPTKIYRSVGPSATTAITTGASNAMTIVGDRATFQTALPDNVGVGDAIQYDDDNDNDIDTSDSIVFINERLSGFEYRVATASGTVPVAVQGDNNWSLFRAYISLANIISGVENTGIDSDLRNFDTGNRDTVSANEQWNFACYSNGTASSSGVLVDGWGTGLKNFIKIYTPVDSHEVGVSQRHNGKWDDNKFTISGGQLINSTEDLVLDGLQFKSFANSGTTFSIYLGIGATSIVRVSNNIIRGEFTGTATYNGIIRNYSCSAKTYIYNNIIYGFINGANNLSALDISGPANNYVYNNTIYNSYHAITDIGDNTYKNNIMNSCGSTCFVSGSAAASTNNISSDANAPGTNPKINTIVSFISTTTGSEDFHLSPTDTAAKDSGADLSGDNVFPFATDIDGQSRLRSSSYGVARWDIGADEAGATQIYRSVAPNKTDALETGEENSLSIVGNTATFQRSLADNVGVGDVIQYDDDNDGDIDANDSLAFIAERISGFEYIVTNASSSVPTTVISDNDWSLFRAYTSLANAETGTENTGIDSDLRNFDTWSGGKDLVASKEQWNIACYANGTTVDTTAVIVDSWTLGVQNNIRIYTPKEDSEVGISQRHNGVWDENLYRLVVSTDTALNIRKGFISIDGLQIRNENAVDWTDKGLWIQTNTSGDRVYISNNIIRSDSSDRGHVNGIAVYASGSGNVYISNNIVYDFNITNSGGNYYFEDAEYTVYLYNNTSFNALNCFNNANGNIISKNNIAQNCTDGFRGTFNALSDYNISDISGDAPNASFGGGFANVTFVDEANKNFHLTPTDTAARNKGINLTSDPNLSITNDIDGETRDKAMATSTWDIGADESTATKIYRSVGPGNTSALATDDNHNNEIEITDGVAIFSVSLPDRIGVGDAVLIDTNSDDTITSADTLLFIHGRNSSNSYDLRTHTGAMPADIGGNDTYRVYRAYTSLSDAEAGVENTAIAVTTFNGGNRDLVVNNEEWNIACYGDSVDTIGVTVNGWITGAENFIKIYTPVNPNEVGVSQRHDGKWGSGFMMTAGIVTAGSTSNFIIDGISFKAINNASALFSWSSSSGSFAVISNCFGWRTSDFNKDVFEVYPDVSNLYFVNNIALNESTRYGFNVSSSIGNTIMYNNTSISNTGYGYSFGGGHFILRNNLGKSFGGGAVFYENNVNTFDSYNNASSDDTADNFGGLNNKVNQTFQFRDEAIDDYRLAMTDASAKGTGLNLTYDPNQPVTSDIEGEQRPLLRSSSYGEARPSNDDKFDIGADQISNTIHSNYSLNLNSNYPSATYSTSQNNNESFSSGDINLEANTWSHIVYKRNADTEELYINGAKKDSNAITDFVKTNNGKLYIGAENPNSKNSFKGFIDEIRIYPYARTDGEIKKDTSAGSAGIAASRASEGVGVAVGAKAQTLSEGLVGYWKMDESSWNGTAQEIKDASGNGNHGVSTGGASTTAGKFGNGGGFDGADDYVNVEGASSLQSDTFTVSGWFRGSPNQNSYGTLFSKGLDSTYVNYNYICSHLYSDPSDNITCAIGNGTISQISSNITVPVDTWYHLVFSVDGEYMDIYINGVNQYHQPQTIVDSLAGDSYPVYFGRQSNQPNSYKGQIDETRIYNRALSPDEVKQLYNYAPGPVLHLKMDEKTGTTTFDSSGNGNDGTFINYSTGLNWDMGKIGSAVNFPGNESYIKIPDKPALRLTGDMSFGAWVYWRGYMPAHNSWAYVVEKGGNPDIDNYAFFIQGNNLGFEFMDGDSVYHSYYSTGNVILKNEWMYISMVFKDSTDELIFYRNGIEISKLIVTDSPNKTYTYDLLVGRQIMNGGVSGTMNGLIDDVKIYNYARTQEQILEDMSGQGGASLGGVGSKLKTPVLDLSFDEGQGNIAYDASGNSNNGTLVASTSGANLTTTAMWDKGGKKGGAMEFDGTDDYAEISNSSSLNPIEEITLSAWIKPYSTNRRILSKDGQSPLTTRNYEMKIDSSSRLEMAFWSGGSMNILSGGNINTTGIWQHVLASYDGTKTRLFINGIKILEDSFSGTIASSTQKLAIGALKRNDGSTSEFFTGSIDEVKIYNYALSEDEVKTLYNDSSALVMGNDNSRNNNGTEVSGANKDYCIPGDTAKCDKPVLELDMDEMTGATANDSSGNGRNGTIIGGPIWNPVGKVGSALDFDGVDNVVTVSDSVELSGGHDISVGLWFNTMSTSGTNESTNPIITKFLDSSNKDWGLSLANNKLFFAYERAPGAVDWDATTGLYGNTSLIPMNWYYASFVYTESTKVIKLYLNGKEDASTVLPTSLPDTNDDVEIGSNDYKGNFFRGSLDDIKIYNYARTPAQIAWDYNRGKPLAHWRFDEGEGVTVHDESGNGYHGTLNNMSPATDWVIGKNNKALDFDGVDDFVNFGTSPLYLANAKEISVSLWMYFRNTTFDDSMTSIIDTSDGNPAANNGFLINLYGAPVNGLRIYWKGSGGFGGMDVNNLFLSPGWYHLSFTYKDGDPNFYFNGELATDITPNGTATGNFVPRNANMRIGSYSSGTEYSDILVDDVKIYNHALTADQVKIDYSGGAVNFR